MNRDVVGIHSLMCVNHTLGFSKEDMRQQSIQISEPTDGQDTNG